jgi:hypothetical protein
VGNIIMNIMESAFKEAFNKNGTVKENIKKKNKEKKYRKIVIGGKKVPRDIKALSKDLDRYLKKRVPGWEVMILNIMPKIDARAQNNAVPIEIQSQVESVLAIFRNENIEKLARIANSKFMLKTLLKIQTTRSIKIRKSGTVEEKRRSDRVLWILSKKLLGQEDDLSEKEKEMVSSSFAQVEAFRNIAFRGGYKRITHCWSCWAKGLDSDKNYICPDCGGIICPKCGACFRDCYRG